MKTNLSCEDSILSPAEKMWHYPETLGILKHYFLQTSWWSCEETLTVTQNSFDSRSQMDEEIFARKTNCTQHTLYVNFLIPVNVSTKLAYNLPGGLNVERMLVLILGKRMKKSINIRKQRLEKLAVSQLKGKT
uniref:Uncharacterized protein n=1 Tax=Strigamia maritima TaxID=126957 RepID=T1JG06_STRMM